VYWILFCNINFQYTSIHSTYTTTLQTIAYTIPVELLYVLVLYAKFASFFLCRVSLIRLHDNDLLRIKTCSNIQRDIVILISKEEYCALCWSNVVKL
jgi:hypothetical protein